MDIVASGFEAIGLDEDDVLIDVGSGDGRTVLIGSKVFGCKSIGIERDRNLVRLSRQAVLRNGVWDLAEIRHEDALKSDLSEATVVYLYHQEPFLRKLRSQLDGLKEGTNILCLNHPLPWVEMKELVVMEEEGHKHRIFLWEIPPRTLKGSDNE
jgi:predicted RNA methylase